MAKYVDCEKAKEMFNRYYHNLQGSEAQTLVCDMKQAFLELPAADVVEVVRCKDCKFYKKDTDYCKDHNTGYCQFDNIVKCKLHFCGYGERRK